MFAAGATAYAIAEAAGDIELAYQLVTGVSSAPSAYIAARSEFANLRNETRSAHGLRGITHESGLSRISEKKRMGKRPATTGAGGVHKRKKLSPAQAAVLRDIQQYGRSGMTRTVGFYNRYANEGLGGERRFFDQQENWTFADSAVVVVDSLNKLVQGAGSSDRIGRKAVIHSVQIRGEVRASSGGSTAGANLAYFYLVEDKQANGAVASVGDVLTSDILLRGLINLSNSKRFRIIKRFVIELNATAGVSGAFGDVIQEIDFFRKVTIPLEFSGATGALTEIKSNNLLLIAGRNAAGSTVITFNGITRIRFSC